MIEVVYFSLGFLTAIAIMLKWVTTMVKKSTDDLNRAGELLQSSIDIMNCDLGEKIERLDAMAKQH